MKRCPLCEATYADDVRFCPVDGGTPRPSGTRGDRLSDRLGVMASTRGRTPALAVAAVFGVAALGAAAVLLLRAHGSREQAAPTAETAAATARPDTIVRDTTSPDVTSRDTTAHGGVSPAAGGSADSNASPAAPATSRIAPSVARAPVDTPPKYKPNVDPGRYRRPGVTIPDQPSQPTTPARPPAPDTSRGGDSVTMSPQLARALALVDDPAERPRLRQEASARYQRSGESDSARAEAAYLVARTLLADGKHEQARAWAERAYALAPARPYIQHLRAQLQE